MYWKRLSFYPVFETLIYFCLGSEVEEYNIKQYIRILSTKFGE